ncbi:hypothetical protein ACHAXS_010826 [Conticribra weissflogii]
MFSKLFSVTITRHLTSNPQNITAITNIKNTKQIRYITTTSAKSMLGFTEDYTPTIQELRYAYFEAAKRYHPDVLREENNDTDGKSEESSIDFRDITEAYEHLLHGKHITLAAMEVTISINEEEEYRQACKSILGIPAEIVEESKQNPMFLHWLGGNTDGAQHWRSFFAAYGGLGQKLRPPAGYLGEGGGGGVIKKSENRRRRGGLRRK